MEFLVCSETERLAYVNTLSTVVAREDCELGENSSFSREDFSFLFVLFHKQMVPILKENGRREPNYTLRFCRNCNLRQSAATPVSPVPFNRTAKAALSSQAFPAAAERLFSDLGRHEGRTRQSTLTYNLEMTSIIRSYVLSQMQISTAVQAGLC